MLEIFLGKKVQIKTGSEGGITENNLQLLDVDGVLIKVQDTQGKRRIINTTSSNFYEIQLQE